MTTRLLLLLCIFFFGAEKLPAQFDALRARQIGPATMSGRITTLAVHPTEPQIMYIGSAGGGVWKSISGGITVTPIFDDYTQSIGKIALAPGNPDVVYVGTGEPWTRNSVSVGTGVYKSTNAGSTWSHIGLAATERIGDIIVHPADADVLYVAALGHLWNANEERGVYKSTDGGASWTKVLYVDENTGATDLDVDPRNPDIVYATTWSFRRQPWTFDSGFTGGSAVYKSTDGGANWRKIHNGLPNVKKGRFAIAVARQNPDIVYLTVETKDGKTKGMYISKDAGENWSLISTDFNNQVRPFYFSNLTVDPQNDSIITKCGLNAIISEDMGERFRPIGMAVHSDIHDIWIDPDNGKHLLLATDGGVYESYDRGRTTRMWMNLPVSQFYRVSVDDDQPYNVYGGLQDNGSWYGPSQKAGGITNSDWKNNFGGDGFYSFRHPKRKDIIFSEYQGGNIVRYNTTTGQAKNIRPYHKEGEDKFRFNWNTPIALSPNHPDRMYLAAQYLFRSEDMGDTWTRISPDLTTNDLQKQQQHLSGGLSIDNSTAENHTTIYTVAESPLDGDQVWVGTDDGNVQLTTDGGTNWTNLTSRFPGLPAHTWVTDIEPSSLDRSTAYVTFDGHRTGDMATYLYRTKDGGRTWERINTEGVAGYALSMCEDLEQAGLLFLGTEFGLYISLDAGQSWKRFENNLPKVGVRDMVIHPREGALVMGTHGRGIIIIDDITPLRQMTGEQPDVAVRFLTTEPTILRDPGAGGSWFGGAANFVAPNPSSSAQVVYVLNRRHTFGKMYMELWKDGELLRTLPTGKSAGVNVVNIPTSSEKPKSAPTNNRQALFGSLFGPNLEAGTYDVKLIKGKKTYETQIELVYDPDSPYTLADRKLQRKTTLQLYDLTEQLAYMYHILEEVDQQASALQPGKRKTRQLAEQVAQDARARKGKLVALEGDFYVDEGERIRERISELYRQVSSYPGKPSTTQVEQTERVAKELAMIQVDFDRWLQQSVQALNERLAKEGLPSITWQDKKAFLSSESVGSSLYQGQLEVDRKTMYKQLINTPIGWTLLRLLHR